MTPSLVCIDAICWASQEHTTSWQDVALDALRHGEQHMAAALYDGLFLILERYFKTHVTEQQDLGLRHVEALILKAAQVTISSAWLHLKTHDPEYMQIIASNLEMALVDDDLGFKQIFDRFPLEIRAYSYHSLVLINLYVCQCGGELTQKTVGEVVDHLGAFGDDFPHINHDRAILSRVPSRNSLLTEQHLSFEHCSVSVMEIPQFPRCRESNILQKPVNFFGWQNKDMIRLLDNKTQSEIHRIQAKYGLEQTDFSEY